ncbi:MAG TPA: hypothetical protein VIL72_04090 [Beijerinckiaceae bacterium]|jgi:DNA-binding NarL/FixJ family response regulator
MAHSMTSTNDACARPSAAEAAAHDAHDAHESHDAHVVLVVCADPTLVASIRQTAPDARIAVMLVDGDHRRASHAFSEGADCVLHWPARTELVFKALEIARAGMQFYAPPHPVRG